MLVFGGLSFKSLEDGGLEVVANGTNHLFLTRRDIPELLDWLQFHQRNAHAAKHTNSDLGRVIAVPPNMMHAMAEVGYPEAPDWEDNAPQQAPAIHF